jgi:tRNA-dihydrouridine synthase
LKIIEDILKEIRSSTKKPFTIKIRKSEISFELLKLAEKYCDAICIHPRTQKQGYSGKPDLNFALEIKNKSSIPVIYSGDVDEKNAKEFLKKFDSVIIGRRAIGNPNIFSKLTNKKSNFTFADYLKLAKKYQFYFRQIKFQAMNFTKGQKNSASLRNKISLAKNLGELKLIIFG